MTQSKAHEAFSPEFASCEVRRIRKLSHDVYWVELEPLETNSINYIAGQYLMLELADGSMRPFSIASSPLQKRIELHIRRLPGHQEADKIISYLKRTNQVRIQLPHGRCLLTESSKPVVFIAGGTGFAPFHSIIKTALKQGNQRPISLYWGAQTGDDLYLLETPTAWEKDFSNFSFHPVISGIDPDWQGQKGFVHQTFLLDHDDISNMDIYIAGSPPMVFSVHEDLIKYGADPDHIYSDILDLKADGFLD